MSESRSFMLKIINHTPAFIVDEKIGVPNNLIHSENLVIEEKEMLFTLLAYSDEDVLNEKIYDLFNESKYIVDKFLKSLTEKGYLEIITKENITEYHIYSDNLMN